MRKEIIKDKMRVEYIKFINGEVIYKGRNRDYKV